MNLGHCAPHHESWRAGSTERPEVVYCNLCYQAEVV